jgi:hypothetical protein
VGDRSVLDVARVDGSGGEHRYMCCMASYGFMGDVMRLSEGYRWMGPARWVKSGEQGWCGGCSAGAGAGVDGPRQVGQVVEARVVLRWRAGASNQSALLDGC